MTFKEMRRRMMLPPLLPRSRWPGGRKPCPRYPGEFRTHGTPERGHYPRVPLTAQERFDKGRWILHRP